MTANTISVLNPREKYLNCCMFFCLPKITTKVEMAYNGEQAQTVKERSKPKQPTPISGWEEKLTKKVINAKELVHAILEIQSGALKLKR